MTGQASLFDELEATDGDLRTAHSLLDLMSWPGIGPVKAINLARRVGTWQRLAGASDEELNAVAGTAAIGMQVLRASSPTDSQGDIRVVGFFDHNFPSGLREIPQPPAVLWVRGTLPTGRTIALVGTRHPTESAARMSSEMAETVAGEGWGVVSGLALGIDILAHRGAMEAGGKTWAFLGSGIDVVTPEQHVKDAERILSTGGGLLSEVPPGTAVSPRSLVARNRLQSGSSVATVVVQCGVPSGTLHTARFAVVQHRQLIVLRPPQGEDLDGEHRRWSGNIALADPAGCEPSTVGATGSAASTIRSRRPVADAIVADSKGLMSRLRETTST